MKGQGKKCFGLLKNSGDVLVNLSQDVSVRLVCPLKIFLPFIPHYPIT